VFPEYGQQLLMQEIPVADLDGEPAGGGQRREERIKPLQELPEVAEDRLRQPRELENDQPGLGLEPGQRGVLPLHGTAELVDPEDAPRIQLPRVVPEERRPRQLGGHHERLRRRCVPVPYPVGRWAGVVRAVRLDRVELRPVVREVIPGLRAGRVERADPALLGPGAGAVADGGHRGRVPEGGAGVRAGGAR